MKLTKQYRLLIKYFFILLLGIGFSIEFEILNNSVSISGNNYYSENPFTGGTNKPRIRWLDWNNDDLTDIFLLDEDGKLKYFQNEGEHNSPDFKITDPSFQNINCGGWFFFADFDNDFEIELITQSIENPNYLSYYENNNGILENIISAIPSSNGDLVISEAVITPTFADIDNDNDLDFFTGHVNGTLGFYENIGFENGVPLFEFQTNEWQNILIIGQSTMMNRHGASAVNFIDLDGDSDLDLTWGDYFQQSLYVVWNNGSSELPQMDITNITNEYPSPPYTIETAGQNMPSFSDLDADGDMDLYITVLGGAYGFQSINNFYQFENVGDSESPLYVENTRNFLNALDFYDKVNPELVDLDNDGDDDLIIGNSFETSSFPWNGRLKYLENTGNQEQPVYEIVNEEFLGILIGKDLTPTFIDIDNDGDLDFFSGETYGSILFAENIGGENNLEFGNITSFESLDLGYSSVPDFVDIDNDNDFDMFIGNSDGNIHYYENIGTPDVYNFILITEQFFEINVENKSAPEFHDLDNDGDYDLIVGSEYNGIMIYENIGNIENPEFSEIENVQIPDIGTNLKPALNQSSFGKNNLYVGNTLGGIYHLQYSACSSGDVNGDFYVNISDILIIVDVILGENSNEQINCHADINSDGIININDILSIIYMILY